MSKKNVFWISVIIAVALNIGISSKLRQANAEIVILRQKLDSLKAGQLAVGKEVFAPHGITTSSNNIAIGRVYTIPHYVDPDYVQDSTWIILNSIFNEKCKR